MRTRQSFRSDERAIEGLPIRLVIAVVVGVAALSAMMSIMGGIGDVGESEVDVKMTGDGVVEGSETVTLQVVDNNGEPVNEATVILKSGTATLDPPSSMSTVKTTGTDGKVDFTIDAGSDIDWRSNQESGQLKIDIRPPGDSNYKDTAENNKIFIKR